MVSRVPAWKTSFWNYISKEMQANILLRLHCNQHPKQSHFVQIKTKGLCSVFRKQLQDALSQNELNIFYIKEEIWPFISGNNTWLSFEDIHHNKFLIYRSWLPNQSFRVSLFMIQAAMGINPISIHNFQYWLAGLNFDYSLKGYNDHRYFP